MVVTKLRLELPNIAEVAVYPATQYVQTTTYIVLYGSASLHSPLLGMSPACHTKIGKKGKIKRVCGLSLKECEALCALSKNGIMSCHNTHDMCNK